jgi:hypothetical protein
MVTLSVVATDGGLPGCWDTAIAGLKASSAAAAPIAGTKDLNGDDTAISSTGRE